jgi:serine/threonine protein kinase
MHPARLHKAARLAQSCAIVGTVEVADLTPGADFAGEYILERPLSRGGMGAVYLATQKSTGRKRALKLMHPSLAGDASARERFEREAKVGALIASEHVVEVVGAGVDPRSNTPWLAMELLEGQDLGHRLLHGALSAGETAGILRQLCHALAAAHAVGVVHRDLKPENVFLSQPKSAGAEVVLKVLDFGIAKIAAESGAPSTAFIGTPVFMAPEQSNGEPVGPYTDVWALGLLTYQLLTGFSYWRTGNSPNTAPMQVLQEAGGSTLDPAGVRAREYGVAERLPKGFDEWFARAVNRDRTKRFADAGQAWNAIAPLLGATADLGIADTLPASPMLLTAMPVATAADAPPSVQLLGTIAAVGLTFAGVMLYITTRPGPPVKPPSLEDSSLVFSVPVGDSPARGQSNALFTVVEYADFECPYSKAAEQTLVKLRQTYGDKLQVVWKDFPLAMHPHAEAAARLAREARREQGDDGFWKMHDALFASQPKLDRDTLLELARSQGLDEQKVIAALDDPTPDAPGDLATADALGISGIPTFFVNGHPVIGTSDIAKPIDRFVAPAGAPIAAITRPRREPPVPPKEALHDGAARGPGVVDVIHFCNYTNFFCVLTEPQIRAVIARHKAYVHYVWWEVAGNDAAAIDASAAVHAAAPNGWALHDRIVKSQSDLAWTRMEDPGPLDRDTLRRWAIEGGADAVTYDYQLHISADEVRELMRQARDQQMERGDIYIDGLIYPSSAPGWELEMAIDRALKARQGT